MSKKKKKKNYKVVRYSYARSLLGEFQESQCRHSLDGCFSCGRVISFYILTGSIFILSVLYAIFFARSSWIRLGESFRDLGFSIAYYSTLFLPIDVEPTLNELPSMSYISFIPDSFEELGLLFERWGAAIFNGENFFDYLVEFARFFELVSPFVILAAPLIVLLQMVPVLILEQYNVDWFKKSTPLKFFDAFKEKVYFPVKRYISDYVAWHQGHYFKELLFLMWFCNMNFGTMIVGFFAWYFYFAKSFDFVGIYRQVYKFSIDILIFLDTTPGAAVAALGYFIFHKIRKNIGYSVLRYHEHLNASFVNSLPVCTLVCGEMGAGKTQTIVDIALTKSISLRNQALERMYKYDLYFPDFPWDKFEKYLVLKMKRGEIYNLASIEDVFAVEAATFSTSPIPSAIYGYDIDNHPLFREVGKKRIYIWKALETYAKLYLVYIVFNSLILSNFCIREDYLVLNCGNFILYETDFFTHSVTPETTHFSHILNYDILRMGKTMIEDTKIRNCFEFGVVVITEVGKERGNNLENLHIKKTSEECNVKNDLFVFKMKMARHAGTIDNYCFCFFIFDEQRPMSLGADLREVCDQIIIKSKSSMRLALPFFFFESALYDYARSSFKPFYYGYRHSHGNRSLLITLLKYIVSVIFVWVEGIYDTFGFAVLSFTHTHGTGTDDESSKRLGRYFLSFGKIYNYRYATDTHAEYCRVPARESGWSLDDSPTYSSLNAPDSEIHMTNAHFVREMDRLSGREEYYAEYKDKD